MINFNPPIVVVKHMSHGLLMNIFLIQEDQVVSDSDDDVVIMNNSDYEEDMAKQLEKYTQQSSKPKTNIAQHPTNQIFSPFKNKLNVYEKSGQKTQNAQRLVVVFNTI